MTYDEMLEKVSEVMHEAWEEWSKAVAPEVTEERRARWEGFWVPYDQLDEGTKDLDREWAAKILEVLESDLDGEMGPPEPGVDDLEQIELEEPAMEEEIVEEGVKPAEKKALEMVTKVNVDASKFPSISKILEEKSGASTLAKVLSDIAE